MKGMPYTTPDDFLEDVQQKVLTQAARIHRRRQVLKAGLGCGIITLALWAVLPGWSDDDNAAVSGNLTAQIADASFYSDEDQAILDSYDYDIFLENFEEQEIQ